MDAVVRDSDSIKELLDAIESAEGAILGAIGRECDALRAGRLLAARAIRTRLSDCARMYVSAISSARDAVASDHSIGDGLADRLEQRRQAFAAMLRVEMAALSAARQNAVVSAEAPPLAESA